jgi:hypothetical protein
LDACLEEAAEQARELPFPWDAHSALAASDASDAARQAAEKKDVAPAVFVPFRDDAGKLAARAQAFHHSAAVLVADFPAFPPVLADEPLQAVQCIQDAVPSVE